MIWRPFLVKSIIKRKAGSRQTPAEKELAKARRELAGYKVRALKRKQRQQGAKLVKSFIDFTQDAVESVIGKNNK